MKQLLLFAISILLLPFVLAASGNEYQNAEKALTKKLTGNPTEAIDSATSLVIFNDALSADEKAQLMQNKILPYAKKNRKKLDAADIAWLYRNIAICMGQQEKLDEKMVMLDSALFYIEQSTDTVVKAYLYKVAGDTEIAIGSIEKGHNYFYTAMRLFESLDGYETEISSCLYQLAVGYLQILDTDGLDRILAQMNKLCQKTPTPACKYDYLSVATAKYATLHENNPDNKSYLDSAIVYSRRTIGIIEQYPDQLPPKAMPSWNYYNIAVLFDDCTPPMYDSVRHYLHKAMKARPAAGHFRKEVEISVYDLEANVYFKQKKYDLAEKRIFDVMKLLDETESYNSLITERGEAYSLLVDIYEKTGRYQEALKYQKLLNENHRKRFDKEKADALKKMEIAFDVEKKENEILNLEKLNEASRIRTWLLSICIGILVIAIALLYIISRQKKKNLEQKWYETALLAELRSKELQSTLERQEATQSKQDTAPTDGIFASGIVKISDILTHSVLTEEQKNDYLTKLKSLNADELERNFAQVSAKMTVMDVKYTLCFYINMDARDIASIFNVEPASVYTVRYRLRKKFRDSAAFRFLT